ncbi:NYN domain-containing protein [Yoonia sediminilitoris]|uniref:Zc3h12a-like ribonuclease protein n=1 Tax=Yoonia sediminilitoris TaxID=1286148 RepID=A0A2T6K7N8_9RHOB|nr:hypothetical protein [Yoonia sediminilitoris]PUB10716.1 Zc3h12a-like ribonuclease protein [Yoonia sediminilitoris]RCW90468.1 Zc3h12a-like ribonuclease protein [Yoonia sediminilitoris]
MRILKGIIVWLLGLMLLCAVVLPETADKARIIDGIGKGVFTVFGLICLCYLVRLRRWRRSKPQAPKTTGALGNPVIVDGSNVMHWGGDPSIKVLTRVLQELQARGYTPLVFFDANVGYKLFDRHVAPKELARHLDLPPDQVTLAPSGTAADEILLDRAVADGLRVVTNDRFLDWKQKFPKVGEKGFLVKGKWQQGSVILLGLGRGLPVAA